MVADSRLALVEREETGMTTDLGMQAVVNVPEALKRIKDLQSFIGQVMVKGEDYGIIPGTGSKPSLLKPGAEKLCEMYGLVPTFEVVEEVKEWEAPFFFFSVKCALVSKRTGGIVAEGLGSCNSRERRYRSERTDQYSLSNTCLKMAKKRAHVDATLSATRSSGLFTQDLEDMAEEAAPAARPANRQAGEIVDRPKSNGNGHPKTPADLMKTWNALIDKAETLGISVAPLDPNQSKERFLGRIQNLDARITFGELAGEAKARGREFDPLPAACTVTEIGKRISEVKDYLTGFALPEVDDDAPTEEAL